MEDSELALQQLAQCIRAKREEQKVPAIKTQDTGLEILGEAQTKDCFVGMLASGSQGNCAFIQCGKTKVLIDVGISTRRIIQGLKRYGYTVDDIDAVFLTHEHADHVKGLATLLKRSKMPIYTTAETWSVLDSAITTHRNRFMPLMKTTGVKDIKVVPFSISHDAIRPVGYSVYFGHTKITLATDLGMLTPVVQDNAAYSDILILEANHDEQMVRSGPYPYHLRQRILGQQGHLSNGTAGRFLRGIPAQGLMKVILAHRSEHNNTPTLAIQTIRKVLSQGGKVMGQDIVLRLASQHGAVGMKAAVVKKDRGDVYDKI